MQNDARRGERYARLSELNDYRVAPDDPDPRGWAVVDRNGAAIGRVEDLIVDTEEMKVRYFDVAIAGADGPGGRARIPAERLDLDTDHRAVRSAVGRAELAPFIGAPMASAAGVGSAATDAAARAAGREEPVRIPLAEEEVRLGKRPVESEVVVAKHVETERVTVPVERRVERVRVERRPVSGAPASGQEIAAGEIRVPLVQEEVVVEKRPVVKEEVVISKDATHETQQIETDVRREQVDVGGDPSHLESEEARRRARTGGSRG